MKPDIDYKKLIYIIFIASVIGLIYNFITPYGLPLIREEIKIGELAKKPVNNGELDYTKIKAIKINQAYLFFEEDVTFVDSRDMWEYADGHIKGAINLPEIEFEPSHPALSQLNKNERLVIYCSSTECGLSTKVAIELLKLGYSNLFVFEEGWDVWVENGYPIETSELP